MDLDSSDFWVSAGVALLCGGAVGLERQLRGKSAGLRTSALICLGTTVFVRLAALVQPDEVARVVGQVVVGVGFLGAGVIINRSQAVKGMTSAAVIWILAGVGSLVALEFYGAALVLTGIVLGVLAGVGRAERAFHELRRGVHAAATTLEPSEDEDGTPI